MQRATVNCYATLHAGKGQKFYNRLCRLGGIKAKDGQRNCSSGSAYQRLRALIVGQGCRRTWARVLRHKKLAVVLDAGVGRRRRERTEGLLDALLHPLFKFTAAFFVMSLLWFVPRARKSTRSGGHESPPSKV